ncbi:hypothetical protein ACFTXO_10290 [Streptomyces sp. NPDC057067]|uniref:DUF1449 family protein n=2 Tax=Streptomyces TaxID=1883 RepID=A0A652LBQ2_9ACTN|nr:MULTISPECIES: hypothetical protein [Streptomyces]WSS62885.1 hypothetical protein OG284_17425 [Streptomyces sp. NBC_01177]WSS69901.1 hypothetical protein OG491_17145 [Streptomyces sp. NBC_01175]WSS76908.1 hypothetical protein OG414_17450 [Streptomyces sp. NBC_01174]MBL1285275.1 hypothetical protein [Streptomyces silvae]MDX3328174.1 hypothetical protein [Streptomyces sp. ME02-6979-3A]
MTEFFSAAVAFPAVVFGGALVVVVCFWLLVLVGAAGPDSFDADLDSEAVGFGGVPVSVSVSLFVVVAWFTGLAGSVLVLRSGATGTLRAALHLAVLAGAILIAWGVVRMLVRRFRRYFPAEPPPSREDFVGQICTIRTGSVSADFGQAEVAAADGSTAIVQVRQPLRTSAPGDVFTSGSTGLLYAYDAEGEFFWVSPYDASLAPRPLPRKAG